MDTALADEASRHLRTAERAARTAGAASAR
jgi:hypothetical protein